MKYLLALLFTIFTLSTASAGSDSTAVSARKTSAEKLAGVIRYKTVSAVDSAQFNYGEFKALHTYLADAFPLVHSHLKVEVINKYSLLYTWQGQQEQLKPVLLSAHLDVVPVESASQGAWEEEPFTGELKDGYVWGRGTMDDKYRVVAILEAVEQLLEKGYTLNRTVYLAFGHDEEVGGFEGAGMISRHLQEQNVQLEAVFDEGLAVVEGVIPGIDGALALVGTAAKGNLNLLLTVNGDGGHSSIPPTDTPIDILSEAIQQLKANPFEPRMIPTTLETFETLAGKMGKKHQFALKHYSLFKGKILRKLSEERATDALIRTKLVPTVISAGEKYNVLPREATAIVNVRILNGENEKTVMQHVRQAIKDDRVKIERYGVYTPPSPVTATDTWVYSALKSTILGVFPDVLVVPALFPGATDSKHYTNLTNNIFRFAPQVVNRESAKLIHNANERLSVKVLENSVSFYNALIRNTCGEQELEQLVEKYSKGIPLGVGGE
ncbi:M20/M25/M40 family metallo-hydrolase [Pontibacter anaerobius]|uniref:M20/M25/M40 family metallo-hydrolase n=1 Tax=Pontibacter anaerobius TaxID=2993940 RepID=A0ABT3RC66_9BACT|nr:M20/M25/M40 family metallo-hydrolase [Pontibacter anaerobius]MCX2739204.1 M20/M25/M40 family metallo-hydrolase [Pontibacter anaerobius]